MAIIKRIPFSSNRFHTNHDLHTIVAEAAELEAGVSGFMGPLYDDAADIGLCILSEKTGKIARWCLSEVKKDCDGDVYSWEFIATPETLRWHPHLEHWKVIVFND